MLKKSHAVHSDTLSPKAAASARHDGVSSVRSRSADAGKTIVVLFVVVCSLPRLHTAYFCICDTVLFGVGSHKWDQFAQALYEPKLCIHERICLVDEHTGSLDQAFDRTT